MPERYSQGYHSESIVERRRSARCLKRCQRKVFAYGIDDGRSGTRVNCTKPHGFLSDGFVGAGPRLPDEPSHRSLPNVWVRTCAMQIAHHTDWNQIMSRVE